MASLWQEEELGQEFGQPGCLIDGKSSVRLTSFYHFHMCRRIWPS